MAIQPGILPCATVSVLCILSLSSCSGSKEDTGALVGAGVCATAASYAGSKLPTWLQPIATGGSAVICSYLGKQIGSLLDEQDRQSANEAAQQALATGKVQRWSNPQTNVSGKSKVVATSSRLTDKGRRPCKTVENSITLADGKVVSENMLICQGTNGQWEPQSDAVTASDTAPADSSATGGVLDTATEKATEIFDAVKDAF